LGPFIPAADQKDYNWAIFAIINTVAWSVMYPQFPNTPAYTAVISKIAIFNAYEALNYRRLA